MHEVSDRYIIVLRIDNHNWTIIDLKGALIMTSLIDPKLVTLTNSLLITVKPSATPLKIKT